MREFVAYLGIGSNQGDSLKVLTQSCESINNSSGVRIECFSSLYQTSPLQLAEANAQYFLNAALRIKTTLDPSQLLEFVQSIEKSFGRERLIGQSDERSSPKRSRILDIDILYYEDKIIDTKRLIIPHPNIHLRDFVLIPLGEVLPQEWKDPKNLMSHKQLLETHANLAVECSRPIIKKTANQWMPEINHYFK